ncbi:MAG: hypothetical protein AMXMBFR34_29230 [Myxococcaceae bacterium]
MRSFAPPVPQSAYAFRRTVVGLAVEPVDALRRWRVGTLLDVALDVDAGTPLPPPSVGQRAQQDDGLERFVRNTSLIFCLTAPRVPKTPVRLRLAGDDRRFVARRLSLTPDHGATLPSPLWLRPMLAAGATYDVPARATVVRGTVSYGSGERVRWARVAVREAVSNADLGVAHGDDRGEFLFVVPAHTAFNGPLADPLNLSLTVRTRPANLPRNVATSSDALWDLPVEPVTIATATPGPPQPVPVVLDGAPAPAGYTLITTFTKSVALSRSTSLELVV